MSWVAVDKTVRQVLQSCPNQFSLRHLCASQLGRRARGARGVSVEQERYELADFDLAVDPNRNAVIVVIDAQGAFLSLISKPFE